MSNLEFKLVKHAPSINIRRGKSRYQNVTHIFFNKQCLAKKIIPNYAKVKIPAAQKTQNRAQTTQIKEEIKFLYKKKGKINKDLYMLSWNSCNNNLLLLLYCCVNTVFN